MESWLSFHIKILNHPTPRTKKFCFYYRWMLVLHLNLGQNLWRGHTTYILGNTMKMAYSKYLSFIIILYVSMYTSILQNIFSFYLCNSPTVTHACCKRQLKWVATLPLGDINMETWSSGMGVGHGANNPIL
jgi:hypothetical protein